MKSFKDEKQRRKLERLIRAGISALRESNPELLRIEWQLEHEPYSLTVLNYTIYQDRVGRYSISESYVIPGTRWDPPVGDERTIMFDRGTAVVAVKDMFVHWASKKIEDAIYSVNDEMEQEETDRLAQDYFANGNIEARERAS